MVTAPLDAATHAMMAALTGARVAIRPWQRGDRRTIAHWPEFVQPAHWSLVASNDGPRSSYAIDHQAESRLIGRITLRDRAGDTARLGIYLHPDYCGQGYGTEALRRFCRLAAETLGLTWLKLDVAIDNARAISCYRKCGFVPGAVIERGSFRFLQMERRLA